MIRLMTVAIFCVVSRDEGLTNCTINWTILAVGAPMNSIKAIAPLTIVGTVELPSVVIPNSASIASSSVPSACCVCARAASRRLAMSEVLSVNPLRCDAQGLCAELLPEWITYDDWGYPMARNGDREPVIAPGDLHAARLAVNRCPRIALSLIATPQA